MCYIQSSNEEFLVQDIENRIKTIVEDFSKESDWEEKYKKVIKLGKELEPLAQEFHVEKFRIKGCQSQVWLRPRFIEGKVFFEADSDAVLVRGIIGLLIKAYSNSSPEEILAQKGDFLKEIGITEHLSMNRTNGLASMMKQIQMYAMVFKSLSDKGVMNADNL